MDGDGLHVGRGGGLRLTWGEAFVVAMDAAYGPEAGIQNYVGLGHLFNQGRRGQRAFQFNSTAEAIKRCCIRLTLYLNPVSLGHFSPRVTYTMLQCAVVREQQQTFRILVETAGRVNAGDRDVVGESGGWLLAAELR